MQKIKMNVTGRVQGVGFRYMTKMVADKIGVYGSVWNEADGSVSIEANGTEDKLAAFIEAVKKSPSPSGIVEGYTLEWNANIPERKAFQVGN